VITVGGASVGERDFLSRAAGTLGEFRSWLVALRPAKPFGFGRVLGVPLFGLPGNPAASVVAFEVLVRPALLRLLGRPPRARPSYPAELVDDVRQRPGRLHLVRARCWREGERRLVRAAGHQGAGTVGSLAAANAWMVLQPEVESLPAGSTVEVRPMWGEGPPEATDP
jgi:molybdopterin molybdotransferase